MSGVRVLVGTRKGAFVLTSDGKREKWEVSGPHFAGWEIYHLKGSPVDPNRLYASQSSGWFGQMIQRSNDGGKTWEPVGNKFAYDGVPGTHQWYDGTQHPWEFKRVWHLEPSLTDPDTVYAGVEDAALFRSTDGGQTWEELPGAARRQGAPLAAGRGRHGPAHHPAGSGRSRADVHRHLGRGRLPDRRRRPDVAAGQPRPEVALRAPRSGCGGRPLRPPHRDASVAPGRAVHAEALGRHAQRRRRRVLARGERQPARPTSASRSTSTRTSRRRSTSSRSRATPSTTRPTASCACTAAGPGGDEWEALTKGLPQSDCYVNVLRDAMAVDSLDSCGVYFGTTGGQVYGSADAGDTLDADRPRPAGRAVGRGPDAAMIRVVLPAHLRTLARVDGEVELRGRGPGDDRRRARRARGPLIRCCAGPSATTSPSERRPFVRFFACEQDLSHEPPDASAARRGRGGERALPDRRRHGRRITWRQRRQIREIHAADLPGGAIH